MFEFKRASGKKETAPGEKKSNIELAVLEVEELSQKAKEHKPVEKVSEKGKFLKLGSHKVTGRELNTTATHIDDSIIQMKNVQIETLDHVIQLYKVVDSLDAEHIAGILAATKAAEVATDWARINDENIGKITAYLMKDERVIAHEKEQMTRIAVLENKVKKAYFVACGAVVVAVASLVICLMTLL